MAPTLSEEIDARAAAHEADERRNPGRFWGNDANKLSLAEAEVFAIRYEEFPRMLSVWDAWFELIGLVVGGDLCFSPEAIERERALRPELNGNEAHLFEIFAVEVGGLTSRQAEAMYWKDWFWTVRGGHVSYGDEFLAAYDRGDFNRRAP